MAVSIAGNWKRKLTVLVFACISSTACVTIQAQAAAVNEDPAVEDAEVTNAVLRTATIYVKNWEASLRFYVDYLGYALLAERPITTEKSLQTIGASAQDEARIAYLKPRNSLIKRPFAGNYLGLIEIKGPERQDLQYDRTDDAVAAMSGEVVLAHQVVGIDDMYKAMQADEHVRIVAPLSLSGAGLSRSFSVIDPNGVRVEIYEFIEGKEPTENP